MKDTTKKSLAECKDEVAASYGFRNWESFIKLSYRSRINEYHDEAAELYASQFIKKEVVSSDVTLIFKNKDGDVKEITATLSDILNKTIDDFYEELTSPTSCSCFNESQNFCECSPINEDYEFVEIKQSTQQPATINLPDTISDFDPNDRHESSYANGWNSCLSELRKRVNCVDPVEFAEFTVGLVKSAPVNMIVIDESLLAAFIEYKNNLTSKTKTNEQKSA